MNYIVFVTVAGGRYRNYFCAAPQFLEREDRDIEVTPERIWLTSVTNDMPLLNSFFVEEDVFNQLRRTDPVRELIYLEANQPPQNFDHLRR